MSIPNPLVSQTKRITLSLGGDGYGSIAGWTDFCERVLFALPNNATRARLRISNQSPQKNQLYAGSWNFTGAWIGTPSFPGATPDQWKGAFASGSGDIPTPFKPAITAIAGTSVTLSVNPSGGGAATLQFARPNPMVDPDAMYVYPHPTLMGYQRMATVVQLANRL